LKIEWLFHALSHCERGPAREHSERIGGSEAILQSRDMGWKIASSLRSFMPRGYLCPVGIAMTAMVLLEKLLFRAQNRRFGFHQN
jgi:hypothetical protein